MVSDETEFAVGEILRDCLGKLDETQKLNMENGRNIIIDVGMQIKVNDWDLVATYPLSSATRKVVAKFKPKFEGPYRVLDVKNNNVVIWKARKRLTINVDQVRIYRHRKCDETEIGTSSSRITVVCAMNQVVLTEYNGDQMTHEMKSRREETVAPTTSGCNLRPRIVKREESRPTIERKTQQGGPVRSRKGRDRNDSPYIEERTRSSKENVRRGGDQQRQDQEKERNVYKEIFVTGGLGRKRQLQALLKAKKRWASGQLELEHPSFHDNDLNESGHASSNYEKNAKVNTCTLNSSERNAATERKLSLEHLANEQDDTTYVLVDTNIWKNLLSTVKCPKCDMNALNIIKTRVGLL
ncbi:uncharacterized protein TNCV_4284491 [Trichonephila clavipes]|uniref:Uncharacterized protein n=1 Tax=Trichonephila clavipes TaxID=2585209 RepID=A0A8X6SGD5_TRICX|nr:uncharacterized protein TNCV_4284491 [Trichonephila clavipes]